MTGDIKYKESSRFLLAGFILIFWIACQVNFSFAEVINRNELHSKCRTILGQNPGCILVADFQEKELLAVVNPGFAFERAYKPGSVFKLVSAAALVENNLVDSETKYNCNNYFELQTKSYHCSQPGGHGNVNMTEALGLSCSIYFYRQIPKLSKHQLKNMAYKMGLRRIELPDGFKYKSLFKPITPPEDPRKFLDFAVGDDKGIQVTSYQILNLLSVVSTGEYFAPAKKKPGLKPETLKIIRQGMIYAVNRGTCKPVKDENLNTAAKTGTATHSEKQEKYHGWFIAYTPVKNPRYGVVVFLEDGRGYIDAVPLGIKVLKHLKTYI
ncbi:MAG: penicillin-binding transpeptidase domain-containing protein [Vulcanimicrobiota bacterium]